MLKTRIGTEDLTGESGSIELPGDITLYCPQCGTEAADKGQCCVSFVKTLNRDCKTGFELTLSVDCRSCGCSGKPPAVDF